MALTPEYLTDYVLKTLGGSHVAVELTPDDIALCIDEALTLYNRFNPLRNNESKVTQAGAISSYELPLNCYTVIDVELQNPAQVIESSDPSYFNIFNNFFLIGGGQGAYSPGITGTQDYALFQIWRNMTMKEFSLDPDYWIEEDVQYDENDPTRELPRKIHFYNPTGLGLRASYVAICPRRLDQVLSRDFDWIKKYTLAHAKEILGYKRRKHSSIPTAGQTLTLDGAELVQEAMDAKDKLEEDLKYRCPLPPPILG